MVLVQNDPETAYTPSDLLHLISSAINNESSRWLVKVKGIYVRGEGTSCGGFYYDEVKDETSDTAIRLVVPETIRAQLNPNELIECNVYLTEKVQSAVGGLELLLNVVELLSANASTYSEAQIKVSDLIKRKARNGNRNVDGLIKTKIIKGETVIINVLAPKGANIENDFNRGLLEATGFYKFYLVRLNLTSEK